MSAMKHTACPVCEVEWGKPHSAACNLTGLVGKGEFKMNTKQCPECGVYEGEFHRAKCSVGAANERRFLAMTKGLPPAELSQKIEIAIPPEVAQYSEDIRRFVDAMVYKLGQKAHKGRWENMPIDRGMKLLSEEVQELTEAIQRGNLVEVLLEAADVGNFALIISAIAFERGK